MIEEIVGIAITIIILALPMDWIISSDTTPEWHYAVWGFCVLCGLIELGYEVVEKYFSYPINNPNSR